MEHNTWDIPKYYYNQLMKTDYKFTELSEKEKLVETFYGKWVERDSRIVDRLIGTLSKTNPREAIYSDFAPSSGSHYITATYTDDGIRRIEYYLTIRIRHCLTIEDSLVVETEICMCPHLHIEIKRNLLYNLYNKIESLSKGKRYKVLATLHDFKRNI